MTDNSKRGVTGKGCLVGLLIASPVFVFMFLYSLDAGCFMCLENGRGAFGFDHAAAQKALNVFSVVAFLIIASGLGYLIRTRW